MLYMTFAAHIVTSEANMGDPEVIVMSEADESGAADPIISYPLTDQDDAAEVLSLNGWTATGDPADVGAGYSIVAVEAVDWVAIVKAVTFARGVAQIEQDRQEAAWRLVIADAMNDAGTVKTVVANTAGISRERAYQIRDGRR